MYEIVLSEIACFLNLQERSLPKIEIYRACKNVSCPNCKFILNTKTKANACTYFDLHVIIANCSKN